MTNKTILTISAILILIILTYPQWKNESTNSTPIATSSSTDAEEDACGDLE